MLSKTQILPVGEKKSAYELSQKETHRSSIILQISIYLKATHRDISKTSFDTRSIPQACFLQTRNRNGKTMRALWIPSRKRCRGKIMEIKLRHGGATI